MTDWLKNRTAVLVPTVFVEEETRKVTASNTAQCLDLVRGYWDKVWPRDAAQAPLRHFAGHGLAKHERPWPQQSQVTAQELLLQARSKTEGALGPDGWTREEVAHLPLSFWCAFVSAVRIWSDANTFPEVWRHARMVCIPKSQIGADCASIAVDKLRPLCVFSAFYQVLESTWTQRQATRDWLQAYVPDFFGGIQGREAPAAVRALEAAYDDEHAIMLSLEYSKCFDHVLPEVAIINLERLGRPKAFSQLLRWVWPMQRRWLQFGKITATSPALVSTSVPQGCPAAPLALCALLAEPARQVQPIFMDVYTVLAALTFCKLWFTQSERFGLVENLIKFKVVAKTSAPALAQAGVGFMIVLEVLGTEFFSRQRMLKVCSMIMCRFYRFDSLARRATGVIQMGARALWQVLAGHWNDLAFFVQMEAVIAWLRVEHFWRSRGDPLSLGMWGDLVWFQESRKVDIGRTGHWLREAWRRRKVHSFLRLPRRDAEELVEARAAYNEAQVKATCKLYAKASAEQKSVLLGGGNSETADDAMRLNLPRRDPTLLRACRFCAASLAPSWDHEVWRCVHFDQDRPRFPPGDPWARRLAWALPVEPISASWQRLHDFAEVRAAVRAACGPRAS